MATVWVPAPLRQLTGGAAEVQAAGRTVREVIDALEGRYPGIKGRLCLAGRLHPSLMVSVDGRPGRLGLAQSVGEESEIRFSPVVAGG